MRKIHSDFGSLSERRLCSWRGINRPASNEGGMERMKPGENQEQLDQRRAELAKKKDSILQRISTIQTWVSNGQEWEDYKQNFVKEFAFWNSAFERAANAHRGLVEKRIEEVISRYDRQIAERESAKRGEEREEGQRQESPVAAQRKPESDTQADSKERKSRRKKKPKKEEAVRKREPEKKKKEPGRSSEEKEVEARKREEKEQEARKKREEAEKQNDPNQKKIEEAKKKPNTWQTIEQGSAGFQYCFVSGKEGGGLYAWQENAGRLMRYDETRKGWKPVSWTKNIPRPPGMGKTEEEKREEREESRKREEEEQEERKKREESEKQKDPNMLKLEEAKKNPNSWQSIEHGSASYKYCYVDKPESQGLYAFQEQAGKLFQYDAGGREWRAIRWHTGLPRLPGMKSEEEEREEKKKEEREEAEKKRKEEAEKKKREEEAKKKREEAEKKEREEAEKKKREEDEAKRGREEEEKKTPEVKKLEEAKRTPDTWCSIEHGSQGYQYCFVSVRGLEGLYAWHEETKQLNAYDPNAKKWNKIEWKKGIPVPPGMKVEKEGEKIEEGDPVLAKFKRKLEEAKRNPNTWRSLQTGTEGYLYCYVEGKGFFAFRLSDGEVQKAEGTEFKKTQRSRDLPRLPDFALRALGPVARVGSQEIGSPGYEGLSGTEYVEKVKEIIKTEDAYFTYEELFLDPAQPNRRFGISAQEESAIRTHGKEVCKVSEQEKKIRDSFGVSLETEAVSDSWKKAERHSMRTLKSKVDQVQKYLEKYPPEFIRNSQLRNIHLFGKWQLYYYDKNAKNERNEPETDEQKKWKWVPCGGYSGGGGVFAVDDVAWAFDHELRHQADKADSQSDNDSVWAVTSHGSEYLTQKVYGEHGQDAILSGTANGPRPSGFARAYGKHGGIDEDQATVAESMLKGPPEITLLMQYANSEPPLRKKIDLTKAFYKKMSNNRMDDQFWRDVLSGVKIDKQYWERRKREQEGRS